MASSIQLELRQGLAWSGFQQLKEGKGREAGGRLTLIIYADLLFCETCKVDDVLAVGVDIQKIDARSKMFHQRAQRPRVDGPVIDGLVLVEFGMNRSLGFK